MLRAIEWILLGSVGTVAILTGARLHRPARMIPWLLLAASIASLAIGDVFYAVDRRGTAEMFYLAMFALVAVSLLQLTRGGALLVDRARLIDMLASTCATLLVVWVFIIGGSGPFGSISAADVIGDLLLLGVAGRLIVAAGRNWSAILLLVGATGLLVSDIAYPLFPGIPTEIGYIVLYVSWGGAALHPSMVRLTEPMPVRPRPWDGRWAALLGLSVATPPVVLLIEAISGPVHDGVLIAVAGGLTLMLAITRLGDAVAQHSQALTRERGLREASAALVAAADIPAVDEAVRAAILQLLPDYAVTRVIFATDDRQLALEALPTADTSPPPASPPPAASLPSPAPPPASASSSPCCAASDLSPSSAASASSQRGRSWWVAHEGEDSGRSGIVTLLCPLWLEPLAVARPSGGALVLTGRRDFLAAARDTLEVLAGQAALALDRISLVEAVGRRDSDLYLRAVIRNTADVMLVIDADLRIRYASPALRTLIGTEELPPLATLRELVHPDDRAQVRQALQSEGDGVVFCSLQRPDGTQTLVEATYRDLRGDRLVQGYVVTLRDVTQAHDPGEHFPHPGQGDVLPAWVNRRSAQHKFRF